MSITSSEKTTRAHITQRVEVRQNGTTPKRESRDGEPQEGEQAVTLTRPKVSFIAWTEDSARAHEIAQALGGEACTFYKLRIVWKPLVPLRYLLNAIDTCSYLLSRRPRAVIATNPPIFPGLIALLYCTMTKAPLLLDSHPSAFGGAPMARQVLGVHAWLTRRAATTMVTVPELAEIVTAWVAGRTSSTRHARPTALLPPVRSRVGRASCTSGGSPAMSRPRRWSRRRGWCPRQMYWSPAMSANAPHRW